MSIKNRRPVRGVRTGAAIALSFAAWMGLSSGASAQEIEPNEFVPAPDGTNIILQYYVHGQNQGYSFAGGPSIKDSALQVNLGITRYVHYDYVFGHPAGFQIIEAYGAESGGHIDGIGLGSTFGASNPQLSAFFWPYANTEKKQYLVVTGFVAPPIGSYDKLHALNIAPALSNGVNWEGDIQIGWDQGIGNHFSYDLGVDGRFVGDQTLPFGRRVTQDPDVRLQAWANWNWTRAFQTSIGWESILGGKQYTNGFANGTKTEFERLRVAASLFVAHNAQVLLEANHDFVHVGGFSQVFGLTARVLFVF